jgi:twitching motility protein PilU
MTQPTLHQLLDAMTTKDASDLYLTKGCPAMLRLNESLHPMGEILDGAVIDAMIKEVLTPTQYAEFEQHWEFNSAYHWNEHARFRVNVFRQQQESGMVVRRISTKIPDFRDLNLPEAYQKLAMEKRGLVLLVGPTGSGKSSSLAAMVGYRNANSTGHIITIEDPIEFIHSHKGCIVTQRDVGIDTISFEAALKNALRQRPDVVLIGEIRDREAMEHAINFAETGHLCLATLHANNSYQAIERVLSFFPEEKQKQVLMNLALNLRGILSQRLLPNKYGKRSIAVEVMLNEGVIRQYIEEGKIKEIRGAMEKNHDLGMQSFDQALLTLFIRGEISEEQALAESDNSPSLRLQISQSRTMRSSAGAVSETGARQHIVI